MYETIHSHLTGLGFSKNGKGYYVEGGLTKQKIRDLHSEQRNDILRQRQSFVAAQGPALVKHFAAGRAVNPTAIDPEIVEVKPESLDSRLFRFASLLWSVPVSQGFGRRLRFLVRDRQNGKLIGIFALGDPVFNLSARDNWVGWTHQDRCDRLVHVMDAYVVGAVPPYSQLIGGKLIAALMTSLEVKRAYERKYLGSESVIRKKRHRARLVLLTTTSALGRSSIYNRLSLPGGPRFLRIGTTRGFGHFHLSSEIFEALRGRVARAALEDIGIDGNSILKHGIEREVYAIPLAQNWQKILLGSNKNVRSLASPAPDIADFCLNRWMIPRARRDDSYKDFDPESIMRSLLN